MLSERFQPACFSARRLWRNLRPLPAAIVSKYDTDNDKSLDLAEVKAAASAHFDKLNKDGDTTLETMKSWV